jgi:hypothetical protein
MKNRKIMMGILVAIIILTLYAFVLSRQSSTASSSSGEAVELIKKKYPELKDYPSDKLAPKSISVEEGKDGWYIAFIQEGSGRPILSATCFFVDNQKNILSMKTYSPAVEEDSTAEFSPRTCSPGACSLENCHGLDILCGSNPPDFCTEMYEIGDNCLHYAKCGVKNGKCQPIENSRFTQCRLCVEECIQSRMNDAMRMFECESTCD